MVDLSKVLEHITGIPHTYDGPYLVCAEIDGSPHIARWDVVKLGPQPTEAQLAASTLGLYQSTACTAIDEQAESLRSIVLTPGSGQMAAYQEKERQAFEYLEAEDPVDSDFPDLVNEVGVTAGTLLEVAHAVAVAAAAWRVFGRMVERARLAGKKAVEAAVDSDSIQTILEEIAWPPCK